MIIFTHSEIKNSYFLGTKRKYEIEFKFSFQDLEFDGKFNIVTIKEENKNYIIEENSNNKYTFNDLYRGMPMEFMSGTNNNMCDCFPQTMWFLIQITDKNIFKYCLSAEESLISGINISVPLSDQEKKNLINILKIIEFN